MNKLVKQALKHLNIKPESQMYELLKAWLEKMYLEGGFAAIEKLQHTK
jgi:hypothetical protein